MKILFVSHDYTRTGAPIVLLRLIKQIKKNLSNKVSISIGFIYERGEKKIREKFLSVADTFIDIKKSERVKLFDKKSKIQYDILFFNTIVSGEVIEEVSSKFKAKKVVSWIHEMDFTIAKYGWHLADKIADNSDEVWCVNRHILNSFEKLNTCCRIFYEFTDIVSQDKFYKNKIKESFNVAISGLPSWRKGIYDIPNLVKSTHDIVSSIKWYGAEKNQVNMHQIKYQLELMDLSETFEPQGIVDDLPSHLKTASVFLMLSHEDPFPLVCLEAASVKVPTICWHKGTGIVDFVKDDAGWILPYSDFQALRELLIYLRENPAQISEKGETAYNRVKESYSSEIRIKEFLEIVSNF